MRPTLTFFSFLRLFTISLGSWLVVGPSWGQWNTSQDATNLPGDCVQITPNFNNRRGAAWHECPLRLDEPFDLQFLVNLGDNDSGADGICFVIQDSGNIGDFLVGENGHSIGFANGPFGSSSVAIELDTFANDGTATAGPVDTEDPTFDHMAIFQGGPLIHGGGNELSAEVQAHPTMANIEDGGDHPFRVVWEPSTNNLEVFFEGSLRHSLTLDLLNDVFGGTPSVYWGFTGSTGGLANGQSFCLESAYYSTHQNASTVDPAAPWEVCVGQDLDLTALPLGPSLSAIWATTGDANIAVNAPGEYDVIGIDADGCESHSTIEVTSLPGPELNVLVDEDLVVCGDTEVLLEATVAAGANVAWDGVDGAALLTDLPGPHEVTASLGDCEAQAMVDVLFQPVPELSFEEGGSPVSGDLEVCLGEALLVQAFSTEGATAIWEGVGSDILNATSSGDYFAQAAINGCEAEPASVHVNVLPLPGAGFVATPSTLCWQENGSLQANVGPDAAIVGWTLPLGTTQLNNAGTGTYEVELLGTNGCESTESFNYTMLPPIATGLVDPEPLCDTEVATLNITSAVDGISWNVGGSGVSLSVVESMGEGPYVATVTLGACTQNDTAFVTWWPNPIVGTHPNQVTRCELDPPHTFVWPTQTQDAVGNWLWTVNGEPASAGYNAYEEGLYAVEIRDNATDCFASHDLFLEVWPSLNVIATPDDDLICIGDSTTARVEVLSVGESEVDEIPYTLEWSTPGLLGASPQVAGGSHFVTATNACGSDLALAEVEEEYCGCHIWVPTAFTPDGDGLNEGFRVISSCAWEAFSFQVFNRWGEVVWSTNDPERPWDGGADNLGEGRHYLPDGWYAYVLQWTSLEQGFRETQTKSGRILMVR